MTFVELNNGCICCTINDDLVKTVQKILERKEQLDYLIVETTGVADPVPVAVTFLSGELRGKTRLDSIITVVDCDNFYAEANTKYVLWHISKSPTGILSYLIKPI